MTAIKKHNVFAKTYYALGWEYESSVKILLKYMHGHPDIPFKISGIVHNEIYIDEVDGIPLMTARDFMCMELPANAVLLPFSSNKDWIKLLVDALPNQKPPVQNIPSLVRLIADALEAEGRSKISIGSTFFPDIFAGHQHLSEAYAEHFYDDHSRCVYKEYLKFLEHPSWAGFESVLSPPSSNFYDPDWFIMSGFQDRERPSAVVELAQDKTVFPEQFIPFMGSNSRYYLLLDGPDKGMDEKRHRFLLDNINPAFLKLKNNVQEIPQKVWDHNKSLLIINKLLVPTDEKTIGTLPAKNRMAVRAGTSAAGFRRALDFSLKIHPNGVRRLRISGRYPESLFLFSAPASDDTGIK